MKVKRFVIAIVLVTISFARVGAKEPPTGENPQPVNAKASVELEESTSILTSIDESPVCKIMNHCCKSIPKDQNHESLFYKTADAIDSTNFFGIKVYIKGIKPIISKMKFENYEEMEIL